MRFVALLETARRDGIGEGKESFLASKFSIQPFDQKIVFMVEHFLQPHAADVAVGRSVNGVAECHVIRGHGLGNCAGCTANAEESACYLLSRANFSEGAILRRIQIDVESLLVSADLHLRIHTISLAAIDGACKSRDAKQILGSARASRAVCCALAANLTNAYQLLGLIFRWPPRDWRGRQS